MSGTLANHHHHAMAATSTGFTVREWKPYAKNTLVGFLTLELPGGVIVHGITLHQKSDSRWVSMPAKEYEKDGQKTWAPIIEFSSKSARERFQAAAVSALEAYMEGQHR